MDFLCFGTASLQTTPAPPAQPTVRPCNVPLQQQHARCCVVAHTAEMCASSAPLSVLWVLMCSKAANKLLLQHKLCELNYAVTC